MILTVQTPTPWLGNTRVTKPVPALEPLHSTKYVTWRAHSACYVLTRRCFVNIHTRVTESHSVLDHTFTVVSCAKHVTSHTRYSYVLKRSSIALCQSVYCVRDANPARCPSSSLNPSDLAQCALNELLVFIHPLSTALIQSLAAG